MADAVEIRSCTADDAPALALIGAATLLEAFAGLLPGDALMAHCRKHHVAEAYRAQLAMPTTAAWLAEVAPGAAPVGYAMVTAPDFPAGIARGDDLELRRIYAFSRFHGGGLGRRLMDRAVAEARSRGAGRLLLGVHPGNARALAFYKKCGFGVVGGRTFHLGPLRCEDPVLALAL